MKILIVDDEPINVRLLEEILKQKYDILSCDNGQDALDQTISESPDLILLDIMMPKMDGFEVLKRIKSNLYTKDITVIMATAKTERDDVVKALDMGASDYIKKPIDITELYSKIDHQERLIIRKKQLEDYDSCTSLYENLVMAQRFQFSLLPDKNSFNRIFPTSFTIFLPKDVVSGDFYFITRSNNKKFICLFDCIGHGVPAAMLTLLTFMALNRYVVKNRVTDPLKVVNELRHELKLLLSKSSDTHASIKGMDAVFCEFDQNFRTLNFIGAVRPIIIVRPAGEYLIIDNQKIEPTLEKNDYFLFYVRGDSQSLNLENEEFDYTCRQIQLNPNDNIYIYSDGYVDQFGGTNNKKFSRKQLFNLLLNNQHISLKSQKLLMYKSFTDWTGEQEQMDDVVLIGINVQ